MKRKVVTGVLLCISIVASAQTRSFKFGRWTEVHHAILKELNRSYVDSLDVDRIERAGVDAMLGSLDPYTMYVPEEEDDDLQMLINKTYGGVGAIIFKPEKDGNVIINEPYAGSPAVKAGLQCGDEIMTIDGQSVIGLTSRECSDRMRGEAGTKVVFKVKKVRSGEIRDITVTREAIHLPDIEYYGMLDDHTGYILQSGFTEGVSGQVRNAVTELKKKGMKHLVLDLRNNGGGLLGEAVEIVSIFVPKGSLVVTAKGRNGKVLYECRTTQAPVDTQMPVTVMINSGSASASEIVSGALQDLDRATIAGERSFGKGLVQSIAPLPYGGKMKLTTAKYYTPSGRCVQAIDYSNRNEDGSVGHIPDSLTHEFKTAGGRTVRDGGGITPDREVKSTRYSRTTISLVMNLIHEQYAIRYARSHAKVARADDFHMTDEDYEDFIAMAKDLEFDYRSTAKTYFDVMKEELEKDGLTEAMSSEIEAMGKALDMEKEAYLRLKKDEIIPILEEEIIVRYHYQAEGIRLRLRYDRQLAEAIR